MGVIIRWGLGQNIWYKIFQNENPKNPAGNFPENQIAKITDAIMRRNYVVT
jgi:hypothetical protein